MNGRVDSSGRALVQIALKRRPLDPPTQLDAWIDTGFTGDVVLPISAISTLGLSQSAAVAAQLGDGSAVLMDIYPCLIDWFGRERLVQVLANNAQSPLLGVGLLRDHKLAIDYPSQTVTIQ